MVSGSSGTCTANLSCTFCISTSSWREREEGEGGEKKGREKRGRDDGERGKGERW